MMLGGQFDYEEDNQVGKSLFSYYKTYQQTQYSLDCCFCFQRALPFNVMIKEISEEMKTHRGSTSKY